MNPWIERPEVWQDFHDTFLPTARELLNAQILPKYFAKIEEHLYVDDFDEGESRIGVADIVVAASAGRNDSAVQPAAGLAAPPVRIRQAEPMTERALFLEIRDRELRRLVAVIELLGPANKHPGRVREQYLAKRETYLESESHFLEIDLLRGGVRPPWRSFPECAYYAVVSRAADRPEAGLWPILLRQPLPVIPVPLRPGDADAALDLQQILHRVYDAAGYAHYIYEAQPVPPLSGADRAWAEGLLAPQTS